MHHTPRSRHHAPICSRPLASPALGQWSSTQIKIITGSSAALSTHDPVSPHSVTAQQYSVRCTHTHTKNKIPLLCHLYLTLCLSQLSSHLHTLSYFSFYPHPHSVFIFQEDVCMSVCVCICTIFSRAETYIFSFSPPLSPHPHLWLIQILLLVLCCSSFFRLKAMCHSLLLSLCLFLHLFLLLPPTQSLSPLPTTFSLVSVDVVVCKLLTARVCVWLFVYVSGVFVCWGGNCVPCQPV